MPGGTSAGPFCTEGGAMLCKQACTAALTGQQGDCWLPIKYGQAVRLSRHSAGRGAEREADETRSESSSLGMFGCLPSIEERKRKERQNGGNASHFVLQMQNIMSHNAQPASGSVSKHAVGMQTYRIRYHSIPKIKDQRSNGTTVCSKRSAGSVA